MADVFELCGKPRNPLLVEYGNVVRCKPGAKLSPSIRKILRYNFQASRASAASAHDLGWFDKPEIISGTDPETGEALYGWWVSVPRCGCDKLRSLHACVKADDCPLLDAANA